MLKLLGRIFGRKDTQECQSDPNHESETLAISYVDRNNATANQNHPYSDFHQFQTSYDQTFNCSGSSNVSSNLKDRSSTSLVSNKQEAVVVGSSSNIKSEKIVVDSETKPNTRVRTFEKRIIDFEINPNTGLKTSENRKIDQDLPSKPELHLSLDSSLVSSNLPSSLFETPAASLHHHPVAYEPTSILASSNLTTLETSIKIEKGDSHLHEVSDDIQHLITGDKLNSSVRLSLSGKTLTSPKCPPDSSKASITSDSSNKKTLQIKVLDISVKKDKSLSYDVAHDCKQANSRGIVPLVLEKHSSPKLDSSSPFPSLERHLTSPKCSSFSKKPIVSLFQIPAASLHHHPGSSLFEIPAASLHHHPVSSLFETPAASLHHHPVSSLFEIPAASLHHHPGSSLFETPAASLYHHPVAYANTRSIAPLVFKKHSSSSTPALDSSTPLPSLERHLTSPKCSSFSKEPTVSFKSTTQQTKNKSIWVQKGASSHCVVSEDFTNLTSIDNAQEDLEKPISEAFHKSDLSLPSSSFGTTPHSPKHPPISNNPTSSFASSKSKNQQTKAKCAWVKKGAFPRSLTSEDSENLININIVPGIFEKHPSPLSPVSYPSSYETPPSSPKFSPIFKPTLSSDSSSSTTQQNKTKYIWVEKGALPLYIVPEDFNDLIKRDIVPEILKKPLSPLTYKDYFAALLYAEDYYIEKWDGFEMEDVSMEVKMKNVSLELHRAKIHRRNEKSKNLYGRDGKENRTFVQFEMESIPEKRPFLLSKDFAYVRPSDTEDTPFKGIIYRIVKSKHLLVEFRKDFYEQHYSECRYDVKFSLNRVCLKRAHKAVEDASDVVFRNFLFPNIIPRSNHVCLEELHPLHLTLKQEQICAVNRIVMHQSPSPYLVEGPLSVSNEILTTTGTVIQDAVLQLLRISPLNRILICAPSNSACDAFMRNLQKEIPISDMFRSNAAFRGLDEVPDDILPHCPYEEEQELFPCPPLAELKKFRLILSTFISTFRLRHEGLKAGHFSHIFLVDASSAIEPETLVPLSNLANEKTVVVVTGKPDDSSRWVRSKIARNNGLRTSYFERLRNSELYKTLNPQVISQLSLPDWT